MVNPEYFVEAYLRRGHVGNLGLQPKSKAKIEESNGEHDYSLVPETVTDIFLTPQVRREFLTAVTSENELVVILGEMAHLYYASSNIPEAERSIRIERQSPSVPGQIIEPAEAVKAKAEDWTPARRQSHGELIKAGLVS